MRALGAAFGLLAIGGGVASALAQTANVWVSHDDPDGIVVPGQTVRIAVLHERSSTSILAGVGGSVVATGDLGVSNGLVSDLTPPSPSVLYPNSPGTIVGGSVYDVSYEFVSHPAFTFHLLPAYDYTAGVVEVIAFDWIVPQVGSPTPVAFDWVPSQALPQVKAILPPYGLVTIEFIPTTVEGTSLLVVPAPASIAALLAAFGVASRRRR